MGNFLETILKLTIEATLSSSASHRGGEGMGQYYPTPHWVSDK